MLVFDKVRLAAFPDGKPQLQHVHVLDLSADGYIKPHIDSIKVSNGYFEINHYINKLIQLGINSKFYFSVLW